jgi:hypothetical protein
MLTLLTERLISGIKRVGGGEKTADAVVSKLAVLESSQ